MYFTECASLAERYPDLASVIQRIDSQLREMSEAEVIRVGDFASFLGVDLNQVTSVFEMLAQDGLLLSEEMIECPYCSMAVLRSEYEHALDEEGEFRCTDCDRPLSRDAIRVIITYRRGEKWKEVLPLPENTTDKISSRLKSLDDNAWYTHDHLAEVLGVGKDALRKRLDRYRKSNLDGWKENEDHRPREPKYLYQLKRVKPVIEDLIRVSSERPAK